MQQILVKMNMNNVNDKLGAQFKEVDILYQNIGDIPVAIAEHPDYPKHLEVAHKSKVDDT